MPETHVVTIERHIIEAERQHKDARGAFSNILYDIALAAKMISREVNKAGLADILGRTGQTNVHGEAVKKLDELGNLAFVEAFDYVDLVGAIASEELEEPMTISSDTGLEKYVVLVDTVDGSSNGAEKASSNGG